MAVLAEEFHAVDVNISLTLFGTMLGLFPVLLGGTPEQAARFFAPFVAGQGAPLAAFAFSEPGGSANFAAPAPAEGVRTQARLEGDHWVISGAKKWVSSGTGWDGSCTSFCKCRTTTRSQRLATKVIRAHMGGFALIPQVVDIVKLPVIAVGGIADGRGLAAAFALGAEGVQIGTAFLPCAASGASEAYRSALSSLRLPRGRGTSAASLARNSIGSNTKCVVPSRYGVFS